LLALDSAIVRAAPNHRRCAARSWNWDGVQFEMLHPALVSYGSDKWKPNARSCTLKASFGTHAILLPGDIEAVQEGQLIDGGIKRLRSTVLLAPHHGSGTSSTLEFLAAVRPELALFQVGYRNCYRHPKAEVWERYRVRGIRGLRSDESGAILLAIGDDLTVDEFRSVHARYWYGQSMPRTMAALGLTLAVRK
jgi:competence protein ComEC